MKTNIHAEPKRILDNCITKGSRKGAKGAKFLGYTLRPWRLCAKWSFGYLRATLLILLILLGSAVSTAAQQAEILTNAHVIEMTKAGLDKQIILEKIKTSAGRYDVTTASLIELKKAGVDSEIITVLLGKRAANETQMPVAPNQTNAPVLPDKPLVRSPSEILRQSKTVAIKKDSVNPSRQALEKELIKRADWQSLNLSITEQKETADLTVQIGFVPLSVITHRYVFRVFDNQSGIVIAAGETTSWGSLAENLARNIAKKLRIVANSTK